MKVLNYLLWDDKLKIYQENKDFMFSLDTILLSKFVTLNKKCKNILDIGTGNAPIPLILSMRSDANITGVEIQKNSYDLALESIKLNNLESRINVINSDIRELYEKLDNNYYDVVVCNPPYFKSNSFVSVNESKGIARSELTLNIDDIFKISKKILKNKGIVAIVNRPDRLADIISSMRKYNIEPKKIQFVYPKMGMNSNHVLVEGTKNGNPGLKVLKPLIIHNDDDTYTNEAIEIFK